MSSSTFIRIQQALGLLVIEVIAASLIVLALPIIAEMDGNQKSPAHHSMASGNRSRGFIGIGESQ